MRTAHEEIAHAPPDLCYRLVADVESWPDHLPLYNWVRFREKRGLAEGVVEMSAYRPFGPLKWPTWWRAEITHDSEAGTVTFRHTGGVTTGMEARWEIRPIDRERTGIRTVHEWDGPRWPLIGGIMANLLIGPIIVKAIARRTLAGLRSTADRVGRDDHIKDLMSEEKR